MTKPNKKVEATRALLHETFPAAFAAKGQPKKPLEIGIAQKIYMQMPEIGFKNLAAALSDYTGGVLYLEACVEGAERVNLAGEPSGVVTALQAAHALARLKAYRGFERQARREPEAASC
jgi:ProP effector